MIIHIEYLEDTYIKWNEHLNRANLFLHFSFSLNQNGNFCRKNWTTVFLHKYHNVPTLHVYCVTFKAKKIDILAILSND